MNRTRILALAGYTTFFWLAFWLFAYWTFPYERLAAFIVDKVAENGSGYTLEIGSLSPYWMSGVELEQVQVRKQAGAAISGPAEGGGKLDQAIRIASARARIGLLGLLTGKRDVSFDADLGTGAIEGRYEEDDQSKKLLATLTQVDLAKLGVLESVISLPTKGTLSGEFDLTLGAQPSKTEGQIKLTVRKLTIGDGKAKLKVGSMGGLTIDPIDAGELLLAIDVKQGVGTVRKLATNGPDLKLDGSGDVHFTQPLARSRLNLSLKLTPTDAYKNKSSRTKAIFTLIDTSSAPQIAAAKAPDGSFQLRLSGTFAGVRALPSGGGARPSGGSGISPPLPQPAGDDEE